jgi:hypothetical protein
VHEYVVDGWLGPHDGLLYGVGDVVTLTNRNAAVHYDVQVGEEKPLGLLVKGAVAA